MVAPRAQSTAISALLSIGPGKNSRNCKLSLLDIKRRMHVVVSAKHITIETFDYVIVNLIQF